MLKKVFVGLVLVLAGFSAQAGVITLTEFWLTWDAGLHEKSGGTATVHYDDGSLTWDQSFQVNVAQFAAANTIPSNPIDDWLTPMAGSGITFDPVDLNGILGTYMNIYDTSMGLGQAFGSAPNWDGGVTFVIPYARWDVTQVSQVSNVPEPGTATLILLGMAGLATRQLKKKS